MPESEAPPRPRAAGSTGRGAGVPGAGTAAHDAEAPPPAPTGPPASSIELRLATIAQLFHTLDPSPFREGDLATEADEFIVGWARALPHDAPISIVVRLPPAELAEPGCAQVGGAIRAYFAGRARAEENEIRELFRSGRRAAVIGLAILSTCLLVAFWISTGLPEGPASRIAQESLVIVGWVAIWRPAEIFLYDWLPFAGKRDLARRLSRAAVEVRQDLGAAA